MATQIRNINKLNSGLCPHGLPPSACPICSNMGGGGSLRVGEKAQKAGEMSYHECAMIGNMLRAKALAKKQHDINFKQQIEASKIFEATMNKITTNLRNFITTNSKNIFFKPLVFLVDKTALPIIKFIQNIPKALNNIKIFKFDIQDKLNAIFGEKQNFLNKKFEDFISNIQSKLENLFKIFQKGNTDNKDKKIDEDKKIFNLKTILHKLMRKKKDKNDNRSKNK